MPSRATPCRAALYHSQRAAGRSTRAALRGGARQGEETACTAHGSTVDAFAFHGAGGPYVLQASSPLRACDWWIQNKCVLFGSFLAKERQKRGFRAYTKRETPRFNLNGAESVTKAAKQLRPWVLRVARVGLHPRRREHHRPAVKRAGPTRWLLRAGGGRTRMVPLLWHGGTAGHR